MKSIFLTFTLTAFLTWQAVELLSIEKTIHNENRDMSASKENDPLVQSAAPVIADFVLRSEEKPLYRKGHIGVGMRYIICTQGNFPSSSGNVGNPGPFVGEVRMFAGIGNHVIPAGWMVCEGQLITINPYQMLFSLIGTEYGGDGRTNFALPDLRGATVVGAGQGWAITEKSR